MAFAASRSSRQTFVFARETAADGVRLRPRVLDSATLGWVEGGLVPEQFDHETWLTVARDFTELSS